MGKGNLGRNLISGLHSLALAYPLVVAAAKYRAANRGSSRIEAEDVDYAVASIEHSFGRSAVLNQSFVGQIESLLKEPMMLARLVRWV
jgi:hypothetical protein